MPSFDELYHEYEKYVHLRTHTLISDRELAADVEQTVWIKVWKHLDTLQERNIKAWLYKIAQNAAYDALRSYQAKGSQHMALEEAYGLSDPLYDDPETSVIQRDLILHTWQRLSPSHQGALDRWLNEPASHKNRWAEKSRMYRARQRFIEHYQRIGGDC